ncbi:hypothetical protein H8356DRAFT_1434999 [Neocallimastix lanati (nom. inval.)]|nr:hypothetical protein H8356DRAFT_1434999 [Neocallimastix sp. JGI-2020a]
MEKNLEIEISKTNREKEQIILNRKINKISNSSIPFNVWVLYVQGYNSIKSQVTRSRRKQLPPDITTFDEIPIES